MASYFTRQNIKQNVKCMIGCSVGICDLQHSLDNCGTVIFQWFLKKNELKWVLLVSNFRYMLFR